ncbi:NEDD4 family-interacting protein 1 [Manis javanica]|nr:NEDD4 family-interacting protein 1 [Manis javanica]
MALALAALAAVEPACGSRYQQLQNEEEPGEPEQTASDAPPPYSSISAEGAAYFDYKDESGFPKPPSYNVATTLPTYDEAERTKAEATIPLVPGRDEDFVGRDDFDDADQLRIGNDGIFMLTFFMAFLFNWIGFFLSFCLTTSAAGRYGAISGFGLSLIKWILIVRFSTYFPGYFDGQYWLWWVFLVLGFLLFLRGFINYAKSSLYLLKMFSGKGLPAFMNSLSRSRRTPAGTRAVPFFHIVLNTFLKMCVKIGSAKDNELKQRGVAFVCVHSSTHLEQPQVTPQYWLPVGSATGVDGISEPRQESTNGRRLFTLPSIHPVKLIDLVPELPDKETEKLHFIQNSKMRGEAPSSV